MNDPRFDRDYAWALLIGLVALIAITYLTGG